MAMSASSCQHLPRCCIWRLTNVKARSTSSRRLFYEAVCTKITPSSHCEHFALVSGDMCGLHRNIIMRGTSTRCTCHVTAQLLCCSQLLPWTSTLGSRDGSTGTSGHVDAGLAAGHVCAIERQRTLWFSMRIESEISPASRCMSASRLVRGLLVARM